MEVVTLVEQGGAGDPRLIRIGRLAAVARGLEREGGYNASKLVRAVLGAELTRYAEAESASGGLAVAAELDGLLAEADGMPVDVRAALEAASPIVKAGSTVPLGVAPRVHACRVCGELFLGESVPEACPTCEAPALSFQEHLPVWYLEPADPGTILAELATGPRRISAAIRGRSDEALGRPPAVGEWSSRETLEHLMFAEGLLAERIPRLLDEQEPDLVARSVWSETVPSDEGTARTGSPASVLMERYRALREGTVARLRTLDQAGWARAGWHPEWGRVTVLSQAAYFARHEASHLAQLVAAAEGRLPGRRPG